MGHAHGRHRLTAPRVEARDKTTAAVPATNPDAALTEGDAADPVAGLPNRNSRTDHTAIRKLLRPIVPSRFISPATAAADADQTGDYPSESRART
jgi:hypothetical protein